ncbi:MAG: LytR C-terminal domain-containing protein [Actinomycetia bacterium]|nr:LytR C-terminal domain-containing protein [Actinomycetes bacterium]
MTTREVIRMARTPVTLLVLLLVLGYGAWWGYQRVVAPFTPPPPQACVSQNLTVLKSNQVTVRVLNGGGVRGFGSEVGKVLRSRGFNVKGIGNTDEKITVPVIIVGAAQENPEVQLVASQFQQVEFRVDQRPDHSVDVLLGPKVGDVMPGAGFKTEIAVPSGTACLPSQTPSPSATR